MPKRLLTKEEYHTRAMLLGMQYDETANTFYIGGFGFTISEDIDADTLKPIDNKEYRRRRNEHLEEQEEQEYYGSTAKRAE